MASVIIATVATAALNAALAYAFPRNLPDVNQTGQRLTNLGVTSSALGAVIPEVWGAARVPGNVIWSSGIKEHVNTNTQTVGGGKASQTVTTTTYTYTVSLAIALARGPMVGVRAIWIGGNTLYYVGLDADPDTLSASIAFRDAHMVFHPGDGTELPDSVIEAAQGVGQVPGFRDLAILMIEDWDITKYGGVPPLTFEIVQSGTVAGDNLTPNPVSVAQIIQDLSARAGFAPTDIDTSEVTTEVAGYLIDQQAAYRDALSPLLVSQFLDAVESAGQVKFRARQGAKSLDIAAGDLAARTDGSSPASPVLSLLGDPDALPGTVSVKYNDQTLQYQQNVQAVRLEEANPNNEHTFALPIVMTSTSARRLADSLKSAAWIERETYQFRLPLSYIALEPGDKVGLPVDGAITTVRITRISLGADGILDIDAVRHEDSIYTSNIAAALAAAQTPIVDAAGVTTDYLLDIPPLQDKDAFSGFYVAAAGAAAGWKNAVLFRSVDGGTTYDQFLGLNAYSILGTANTVLGTGENATWDDVNTLDVTLLRGTIAGATDLAVINGANIALVGNEIVQFATVTPLGGLKYRLSRLLRGRRDTEWAIGAHVVGERFVLLNTAARAVEQVADIGRYDNWKMVANGQIITAVTAESFRNTGESLRPFSPVHIKGARDGSGNLTITWIRRSRIGHTLMDNQDIPLGEDVEKYEIDVLSGTTVLRTITATTAIAAYSAADQTTDFGATQPNVALNIYQTSAQVGRGRAGSATV